MATHFNISGELTQELLAAGDGVGVNKISLTNIHADTVCNVDLYIEKKLTGKFYLVKGLSLPSGAAYVYSGLSFDNKADQFGLYIKLTGTIPTVDVIIS